MAVEEERRQMFKFGLLFIACFVLYFLFPTIGHLIIVNIFYGSYSEFINLIFGQILPFLLIFIAALFFILFLLYLSSFAVGQGEAEIRKELTLSGILVILSLAVLVFLQTSLGRLLTSDTRLVITQIAIIFLIASIITLGVVGACLIVKKRQSS